MLDNWQERFPNCEPISHRVRDAFRERWVRFHSLPESKRYPEDASEYQILFQRHSCILSELLGTERRVVLLTTGYSETPEPVRTYTQLDAFDSNATPWQTVALHVLERDFSNPNYWHVFASEWEWRAGLFDPLIRLVADDAVANVMIVHPTCRWLLHPYDGGMDVIAESPAERDRLRAAHEDWLSEHASGM
jgi:hypothetical protein